MGYYGISDDLVETCRPATGSTLAMGLAAATATGSACTETTPDQTALKGILAATCVLLAVGLAFIWYRQHNECSQRKGV